MLPFTSAEFFQVFAGYHAAIWPMVPVAYLIGIYAMVAVRGRSEMHQRGAFVAMSVLWLWTGLSYFSMVFAELTGIGKLFGFMFMLGGGTMLLFGLGTRWPERRPVSRLRLAAGVFLALYAMVLYPLLNAAQGHVYPAAPSFGITPCPLTIFTFALLLLTPVRPCRWMYIIPAVWAVIGGSAAFLLGVAADFMLPVSALIVLLATARLPGRVRTLRTRTVKLAN